MAVSGSGGWIPSNQVRLESGQIRFIGGYTQNKPKDIVHEPEEAAERLRAGLPATVDVRNPAMRRLKELLGISDEH